jgi:polysaccharide export outer membrane protein
MIRSLLCLLALLVLSACAGVNPALLNTKQPGALIGTTYRIGVDDGLQVSVWRNPELSVQVPVRPDGKISVPLIGDVQAGGLTPEQVAKSIREKLANYIRDPNVTVIVTSLRSHEFLSRIRVTGAVNAPKSMPYRQGMTILDAVLEAGGVNDFAAPNRTKLYRRVKGKNQTQVFNIDLGDILYEGSLGTNALLIPGDVITVPERIF